MRGRLLAPFFAWLRVVCTWAACQARLSTFARTRVGDIVGIRGCRGPRAHERALLAARQAGFVGVVV